MPDADRDDPSRDRSDRDRPAQGQDHDHNPDHRYRARVAWTGSTGAGYDRYDRAHAATAAPADLAAPLTLSSDPAFRGDPRHLNPEQLVVLAASSCQLLSFLAVAARARLDVVAYEDDAEGTMPADARPLRIVRIDLRPRITLARAAPPHDDANTRPRTRDLPESRLHRLVQLAHEECFIANSLRTEIVVSPTFARALD